MEQLVNRIAEENAISTEKSKKSYPTVQYKRLFQISKLEYEEFIISPKALNNCIISNNIIILINEIVIKDKTVYLCGNKITGAQSLFLEPCNSQNLNIFVINNINFSEAYITISAKEIQTKCLKLLIFNSEKYVIMPLIHHQLE